METDCNEYRTSGLSKVANLHISTAPTFFRYFFASQALRPRLHEQIKRALFAQIRPELLHTVPEFEQSKEVLFAYANAALTTNQKENILKNSWLFIRLAVLLVAFSL